MYKARKTIRSFDYYEFTINEGDIVEFESIDIIHGNVYANLKISNNSYKILLEIFEKYFDKLNF